MSNRILLVEDDVALGQQIVRTLSRAGFEPRWVQDGDAARGIDPDDYRVIVLDLMLPGTYGMDLLKRYRLKSEVPVLILSARDDTADKIRGLKLGADDYVTKPFFPEELIARIQACLRRPNLVGTEQIVAGAIGVDLVDAALDSAQDSSRRTLDVHISRLRSKLGEDASQLQTVWGIGYRLSESG